MAMPLDLVMVRHGESEANIVQRAFKDDPTAVAPEGFLDRHDSRMRLSSLGREQADVAGALLRSEFPGGFDTYYVSALTRTLETASCLKLNGVWSIDDRWRERDWGEYGFMNDRDREAHMPRSVRIFNQAKWYWCPPGGESLATGVRLRFEDILDTLHREQEGKTVIAVTHGEMMGAARFVLERLTPEVWMQQDDDPDYKIANTMVFHYSRRDPQTGKIGDRLDWMRAICPWDKHRSWYGGQWHKIERKKYSDADLRELIEAHQPLLDAVK